MFAANYKVQLRIENTSGRAKMGGDISLAIYFTLGIVYHLFLLNRKSYSSWVCIGFIGP